MTNAEAMKELKILKDEYWDDDGYGHETKKYDDTMLALDMAIKALEQESVLDKMKDEIKEWYWDVDKQALAKDPCVVDAMVDLFIRIIDKYKEESEE